MLGVTLRWTGIPSRGSRNTPSRFMPRKPELSAGLMGPRGSNADLPYLNDFRCKYQIDPRPLSFYGLVSAVKSLRSDFNFQDLHNANYEYEPLTAKILEVKKATTLIYKNLISNKSLTPESSQKKIMLRGL